MGAGIAVAFRKRWPDMYKEYRRRCLSNRFGLGDIFPWVEDGITIFNLGTQPHWRKGAELWAVREALSRMTALADERKVPEIGLPRIGAGLGGLEWASVRGVLEEIGAATSCQLRICETYVAGQPLGH